jgi:hypothetical protein
MLDWSHRTESNDSIQPLSRALIGGVQPKYGWWAPVAALYKEVGVGAHDTRFTALLFDPPTLPTDLGLALVTGSSAATTHPCSRHHPSPWPVARVPQAMDQVITLSLCFSLRSQFIRPIDSVIPTSSRLGFNIGIRALALGERNFR